MNPAIRPRKDVTLKKRQAAWWIAVATAAALAISGCGYRFQGEAKLPAGAQTVFVSMFENRTNEPALETIVTNAVVFEFIKRSRTAVVGDASEADTYYISASRSFGKLSWSLSYANFYNGVRFDAHGTPQVVRIELPDQRTFSSDWFLAFNRGLAVALDYSYLSQAGLDEHQFFVRLILRK